MRKVKDRSKRAEPPHVSEEATPFNSPCLCRFYLAGYAVSTMQAAPFIPGGFGKGIGSHGVRMIPSLRLGFGQIPR